MPNNSQNSLTSRAKTWLSAPRTLEEIQDAHLRLVKKTQKDKSIDPQDGRTALEALIEGYVDAGGEMFELYQTPEAPQGAQTDKAAVTTSSVIDLSPLCPDVQPTPPLTMEEKAKAIQNIRAMLVRPSQVSAQ
ncbi:MULTISPECIES: hypothetical protein [Pseudomonas]|uniref:Uncharacterized protein n=2 Tax=Pseudomonas TaxID=286 RepID=A0A7S6G546_PSEAI|nr:MULTISPECIES: hypothetical protein [Pseudomonas]MCP8473488.1 hypothetical protein [Pseudomonas triclosanedens]MCP8479230.1 hypothetical protein [Pseudomonas triclosanedens]EKD1543719.1 hypothetical protein [Pseudomonas aeruginosa]EKD2845629.1 hypothetical protein [Pseudomonas aeruginosa]EKV8096379.1 hypothetical protein [Pseudomonas aeruginosa]